MESIREVIPRPPIKMDITKRQLRKLEMIEGVRRDRERAGRRAASADQDRALSPQHQSQSERDWRYAIRKLKAGEDPEKIIRDMAGYRSKDRYDKNDPAKLVAPAKAQPYYYAEQTVTKAMATLGMTKQPARMAKAASSRETETMPSR